MICVRIFLVELFLTEVFSYRYDAAKINEYRNAKEVISLSVDLNQLSTGLNDLVCKWNTTKNEYDCTNKSKLNKDSQVCSQFITEYIPKFPENGQCQEGLIYRKGCALCDCVAGSNDKQPSCNPPKVESVMEIDSTVMSNNESPSMTCKSLLGEWICRKSHGSKLKSNRCPNYEYSFPPFDTDCNVGNIYLHSNCRLCICHQYNSKTDCAIVQPDSDKERNFVVTNEKISKLNPINCEEHLSGFCRLNGTYPDQLSDNSCSAQKRYPLYKEPDGCNPGNVYRVGDCKICLCREVGDKNPCTTLLKESVVLLLNNDLKTVGNIWEGEDEDETKS